MNKTIITNDEWAVGVMEQLDTMLDGIENMNEKSKVSFGNERFLTDKEVSAWLKVSDVPCRTTATTEWYLTVS